TRPIAAATTPVPTLVLRSTLPLLETCPATLQATNQSRSRPQEIGQLSHNQNHYIGCPERQHKVLHRPSINKQSRAGADGQMSGVVVQHWFLPLVYGRHGCLP